MVTAADLADRVGGSLADADNLSSKLGTALTIVALLAAFLIATLLTLASVQKHIRELGTLKALGWRQRLVVRQVAGESLVQGALGGLLGAAIGIAGAAIIDAVGPTLEASVERSSSNRAAASTRSDRERSPPAAPRSSSEPRWIQGWWRWRSALRSSAACSRAPPEGCARRAFARPTRYGARSEQQRPPRQRGDDEQASRDHPDLRARGGDPILRRGLDPGLGVGRARPDDQAGRVRRHLRALGLR
ncbi:MAG: FtsX-like permease family protein [Thermoleophilaceae bacterium]